MNLNASDIDRLVDILHENGLSHLANALNLFLCNAKIQQKQALAMSINKLYRENK